PAGEVQGHRRDAGRAQLRPVPAVRRAHVPGQGQGPGQGALANDRYPGHLTGPERPGRRRGTRAMTGVQQTGERVEALIAALSGSADPAAAGAAEELVGLLVGLYGDGLARIVAVLGEHGEAGAQLLDALTRDPLVASLLVLHDLHPLSTDERIQQALDEVRPYLGSHAGGVQYLGVTDGVARLRREGICQGSPSSRVTARLAIETAVRDAAPEVTGVVVDAMTEPREPALLQIGPAPSRAPGAGPGTGWVTLPALGPPSARP